VHLRGDDGALLAVPAPEGLLVVALADAETNVGLARLEMVDAAARVA
jgi:predicted regulator of Ras-like GTPase activity (Roadblock/LC7/MglB family)